MFRENGGVWPEYEFLKSDIPVDGEGDEKEKKEEMNGGWWGSMYKFVS